MQGRDLLLQPHWKPATESQTDLVSSPGNARVAWGRSQQPEPSLLTCKGLLPDLYLPKVPPVIWGHRYSMCLSLKKGFFLNASD